MRTKGNSVQSATYSITSGNYRLYFNTEYQGAVADIKGTV